MIKQIIEQITLGNSEYKGKPRILTPELLILECLSKNNVQLPPNVLAEVKKNVELLEKYGLKVDKFVELLTGIIHHLSGSGLGSGSRSTMNSSPFLSRSIQLGAEFQAKLFPLSQNQNLEFKFFLIGVYEDSFRSNDFDLVNHMIAYGFNWNRFIEDAKTEALNGVSNATSGEPMIAQLCEDLSVKAAAGKLLPVIGRDDEIEKAIEVLSKRQKNAVVLIGPAGTGKTAIAEGLALAIKDKKVPDYFLNSKVFVLTMTDVVAGTKFRGEFESKMKGLMKELKDLKESGSLPILFVDEIHTIVGAGSTAGSSMDVANILKPSIARGEVAVIGATTQEEWNKYVAPDKAMKRRFTVVDIAEPSKQQTLDILKGIKSKFESHHGLTYSDESLTHCIDLAVDFIQETSLPDKAIELLDYSGAYARRTGKKVVDSDLMEVALSRRNKVALESIRSYAKSKSIENETYVALADRVKEKVFSQDEAVTKVSEKVEEYLAGMNSKNKPIGAFLLIGPTGVGKTELAVQIAEKTKFNYVRLDMSDYMESHSVAKLIGSPAGYVRSDESGRLEMELQKNPQTVLLLDEMEKAHPDIQKVFLQILDNGSIVTAKGDRLDFSKTLILMTSNVGASAIHAKSMGFSEEKYENKKINKNDIKNAFLPEFLGRVNALGGIVEFNALNAEAMEPIVKKMIGEIVTENLEPKGISLKVQNEVVQWIISKTYTPEFGARNLKSGIDEKIKKVLTKSILSGEIRAGKKSVTLSLKDDALEFKFK